MIILRGGPRESTSAIGARKLSACSSEMSNSSGNRGPCPEFEIRNPSTSRESQPYPAPPTPCKNFQPCPPNQGIPPAFITHSLPSPNVHRPLQFRQSPSRQLLVPLRPKSLPLPAPGPQLLDPSPPFGHGRFLGIFQPYTDSLSHHLRMFRRFDEFVDCVEVAFDHIQ